MVIVVLSLAQHLLFIAGQQVFSWQKDCGCVSTFTYTWAPGLRLWVSGKVT